MSEHISKDSEYNTFLSIVGIKYDMGILCVKRKTKVRVYFHMEMMGILQIELMYSYIICIDSCFWFKANKNSIRLSFANPVKVLINVVSVLEDTSLEFTLYSQYFLLS